MRKDNTKDMITEVAIELIKEKGYNNISVADICKQANITKPTFYYHFGSKDDILSFISFEVKPNYSLLKIMATLENPWQKIWVLAKNSLEQFQLTYGKEVIKTALSLNIANNRNCFTLVTGGLEDLTMPLIEQCLASGIMRFKADPSEITYYSNMMFIGLVVMWATDTLQGDIYELLLRGMEIVYDVNPEYYFPIDMI